MPTAEGRQAEFVLRREQPDQHLDRRDTLGWDCILRTGKSNENSNIQDGHGGNR